MNLTHLVALVQHWAPVPRVSPVVVLGGVEVHIHNHAQPPEARDDDSLGPLVPGLEADDDIVRGHV